jgi:hypothetical protein
MGAIRQFTPIMGPFVFPQNIHLTNPWDLWEHLYLDNPSILQSHGTHGTNLRLAKISVLRTHGTHGTNSHLAKICVLRIHGTHGTICIWLLQGYCESMGLMGLMGPIRMWLKYLYYEPMGLMGPIRIQLLQGSCKFTTFMGPIRI